MANVRRWPRSVLLLCLALAAGVLAPGAAPPAAAAEPSRPGGFTAVTPARLLDTRSGLGAPVGKVGSAQTLELQVTGRGGVPSTGVSAVALNVTVTEPTNLGYLTVFPTDATRPVASSVNFVAGQTVPNAVVVKVGTGGRVSIFNSSGTSHLVVDVASWHATARVTGSPFAPVTPERIHDTRSGSPLSPGGTMRVHVPRRLQGLAEAVALNVTATQPTSMGYLTVFPAGDTRPLASNLNLAPGETRANFVAVKVADDAVDIYNGGGRPMWSSTSWATGDRTRTAG